MNITNLRITCFVQCLIFLLMTSIYSCKESEPTYSISGRVFNPTSSIVRNANVSLLSGTDVISSIATDENGDYTLENIASGKYVVRVEKNGYNTLLSGEVEVIEDLEFNLFISGDAVVSGVVTNSQTGGGLSDARVRFIEGTTLNNTDTTFTDLITITDELGNYLIEGAPTGNFICVVEGEDFVPRVIENLEFIDGNNPLGQSTLVETVGEGEIRIVLTWGLFPSDLDTHLTGPLEDGISRFHMYYSNRNPTSDVFLDVDDVSGFGPETTTILELKEGVYRYSVFNFSNSLSSGGLGIYNSPTKVEIFDINGLLLSFDAPVASESSGNTWKVFEIEVEENEFNINPVNSYSQTTGGSFRVSKHEARFEISDF